MGLALRVERARFVRRHIAQRLLLLALCWRRRRQRAVSRPPSGCSTGACTFDTAPPACHCYSLLAIFIPCQNVSFPFLGLFLNSGNILMPSHIPLVIMRYCISEPHASRAHPWAGSSVPKFLYHITCKRYKQVIVNRTPPHCGFLRAPL